MPVTIQPATLKYKNSLGNYQSADSIKGDKGDKGNTGDSGVYYGTTTPTDPNVGVWIDPSGGVTAPVTDVQINETSVLSNGVANIPVAGTSTLGVCKISGYGLYIGSSGLISINKATSANIKAGISDYGPIVPTSQHESVFYGLAKAAGSDEASSTETVGTYTAQAKTAIKTMLGVTDLPAVTSSDNGKVLQVVNGAWTAATIPNANGVSF